MRNGADTQIVELLQGRSKLGLTEALTWGSAVLDEVYGGEPNAWRSAGTASLRSLSRRAGISVSTTYRYVAVAALWRACGSPPLEHLGVSHLRELLPLRPAVQAQLLRRAEREKWTVLEIRAEALKHQRRDDSVGRGRPARIDGYRVALGHLQRWTEADNRLDGLEALHELAGADAEEMLQVVQIARSDLDVLEARLAGAAARP